MAQGNALPPLETTVANLPTTGRDNRLYLIVDGNTTTDVATGGGQWRNLVFYSVNAAAWKVLASVLG